MKNYYKRILSNNLIWGYHADENWKGLYFDYNTFRIIHNIFGLEVLTVKCPIMDFLWLVIDFSMSRPPENFNLDSLNSIKFNKKENSIAVDIKCLTVLHIEVASALELLRKHKYLPFDPPYIIGLEGIEVQRTEEIIRFYIRRLKT